MSLVQHLISARRRTLSGGTSLADSIGSIFQEKKNATCPAMLGRIRRNKRGVRAFDRGRGTWDAVGFDLARRNAISLLGPGEGSGIG